MNIIGKYKNGNYNVMILEDGTKIRFNNEDKLVPDFPESMDLKITNRCDMGCPMCFIGDTKILMGDYTYKNIQDVQIGDEVIGFEENPSNHGSKRKIIKTKVLNTFVHVESELIKTTTDNNNCIISTPNHPFFSEGTGKNHARLFNKIENINVGKNLFTYNLPLFNVDRTSKEYQIGYIIGAWIGDGNIYHGIDKNGYDSYSCRFVTLDEEINDKVFDYTNKFISGFYRLPFKMTKAHENDNVRIKNSVRAASENSYNQLNDLISNSIGINTSIEYCCGFLAGFCDSEGHVDNQKSIIRLFNTNITYINEVIRCLKILNIDFVIEKREPKNSKFKTMNVVRLKGKNVVSTFLWYTMPVCPRKTFENYISKQSQYYKTKIIAKEIVNKKQYVYNFETDCHTYIANNFLVHNCHEDSTKCGKHGDILNSSFLKTLHPYTELAIGGGNPLSHPDLIQFLHNMKNQKMIPSMTVHQKHFMDNLDMIHNLVDNKLIYGLGISLIDANDQNFIKEVQKFPNAVIHIINGLVTEDQLRSLAHKHLKVLVLGYKEFRRGKLLYNKESNIITNKKNMFYNLLNQIIKENWFEVISFDNLSIQQLDPKRLMSKEHWDEFYMGNDGQYTMFVDLVTNTFSTSSITPIENRHCLLNNITEMFNIIHTERIN